MFHITWGAGLCTRFMTSICPMARPVGHTTIPFITTLGTRGPLGSTGMSIKAGVWRLTQSCLESLDSYRECLGDLDRATTLVTINGAEFQAQMFLAVSAQAALFSISSHIGIHRRGYEEWGFPQSDLDHMLTILDRVAA